MEPAWRPSAELISQGFLARIALAEASDWQSVRVHPLIRVCGLVGRAPTAWSESQSPNLLGRRSPTRFLLSPSSRSSSQPANMPGLLATPLQAKINFLQPRDELAAKQPLENFLTFDVTNLPPTVGA